MKSIAAAVAILSATFALAAPAENAKNEKNGADIWSPNGNNWNGNNWNRNNWNGPGQGYRFTCGCQINGQNMPWLGEQACSSLSSIWPNLQSDGNGNCYDLAGQGLDPSGFEAACQRVANGQGPGWQPSWWGNNNNNNPFQPQAIRGNCSPF